ncbi:glycosyltransferase [Candidatus Woesearchaeota archaeon]|nr:glycosyltransferase [Candidatus Woesearchaeota archaeon]
MTIIAEQPKADFFFEVSWEVCNKVGGIYTVVSSKAESMMRAYANYYLIGPYFPNKATGEFHETVPPHQLRDIFDALKREGIICHFGKWLIGGGPSTILIDFTSFSSQGNAIKGELWSKFQIDSLGTHFHDYDEPTIWSYSAGKLIDAVAKSSNAKVVAQFHEWLSAGGLLYLKAANSKVATVFTTHATMIGRTLASNNVDLYNKFGTLDGDSEAKKFGIQAKHLTEKAAAHNADIFTTVSEITGIEAKHLLGKEPDLLLPNGLHLEKFPTMEEIAIKHQLLKTRIKSFLIYYFFPYYQFNLAKTYIYFIVGRYEYHDKGIDVFVKALGQLNQIMKKEKSNKTVVAFFWIPANVRGIKPEVLESRANFMDIHESIEDSLPDIKNSLILSMATGAAITAESVFGAELTKELKKKGLKLKKSGKPPIATHDLYDEAHDSILNGFAEQGLTNSKDDKVKVVYYPTYLTGSDGLLDLNYYEAILGSQLGIFPSYYEPWGYTPLEAAALGVASVTTDLAGFGRYICKECKPSKFPGIYVVNRMNRNDGSVVENLKQILLDYTQLTREERIANKYEAKKISSTSDWKNFAENYIRAHNMAVDKH